MHEMTVRSKLQLVSLLHCIETFKRLARAKLNRENGQSVKRSIVRPLPMRPQRQGIQANVVA
jgi:hypothetical protein